MPTLLITRPEPHAATTIERLELLGYTCLSMPMLTISPTHTPYPAGTWDCVMITSQNVFQFLSHKIPTASPIYGLPCYCVGAATAEKARASGFTKIFTSQGNAKDLIKAMCSDHPTTLSLLHISGEDTTEGNHTALRQAGHNLTIWPIYKATQTTCLPSTITDHLRKYPADGVLFYSIRTAKSFASLFNHAHLADTLSSTHAFCLSPAIAHEISHFPWRGLTAATQPSEDGLVQVLQRLLPINRV